jgi:hypothetical protein
VDYQSAAGNASGNCAASARAGYRWHQPVGSCLPSISLLLFFDGNLVAAGGLSRRQKKGTAAQYHGRFPFSFRRLLASLATRKPRTPCGLFLARFLSRGPFCSLTLGGSLHFIGRLLRTRSGRLG